MIGFIHWLLLLGWGAQMGPLPYESKTIEYAVHAEQKLGADIVRPTDKKIYPGVIVVHGGSWGGRSREDMTAISEFIASHGFVVMNLSYRFAPQFLYPAQIEDLAAGIAWFKAHAAEYGMDATKLGGWGYSAGAHLVTQWAFLESEKNQAPAMVAIVAGGAPFDLRWYPESPIITKLLDGFRDQRPKEYFVASPVNHVGPWVPKMFMYHGKKDVLVEAVQSSHMQNLVRDQGVEAQLHVVDFWGHIGTFLWSGESLQKGILFLKEKLK